MGRNRWQRNAGSLVPWTALQMLFTSACCAGKVLPSESLTGGCCGAADPSHLLQAKELQCARKAADESAAQAASANQLMSGLQADKASLAQQVKKLTAEKAGLSEQLGSSAGDIDMLQVRADARASSRP